MIKTINQYNFFKNSYCEFQEVSFDFSDVRTYKSKSGSIYHYTEDGVYRYSNHWGRVANCRWKLNGTTKYKNQNWYTAYSSWTSFFDLTSKEKCCFLKLDSISEVVSLNFTNDSTENFLFSLNQALKRKKEIDSLFKNSAFLSYYDNPEELREKIIKELQNTNIPLSTIKKTITSL